MINKKIRVESRRGYFIIPEESCYQRLFSKGFGFKSENYFELEIYEVLFLLEKEKIEVFLGKKLLSFDYLLKKVDSVNYTVYNDLRGRGYRVKSGLKYGTVFRVYTKAHGDKHSSWLVDPIMESDKIKIKDLVGKNRVAHTTNKKVLFAVVDNERGVTYIENCWLKV